MGNPDEEHPGDARQVIKVNRRTLSPTHNVNATMVTPSQQAGCFYTN
jgi:hypothetical protein